MALVNKLRNLRICVDFLSSLAGWLVFNVLRYFTIPSAFCPEGGLSAFLTLPVVLGGNLVIPLCMVLLYAVSGVYNDSSLYNVSRMDKVLNTAAVGIVASIGIYFAAFINDGIPERMTTYELLLMMWGCLVIPTATARCIVATNQLKRIRRGHMRRRILVVDTAPGRRNDLRHILEHAADNGFEYVGIWNGPESCDLPALEGEIEDVVRDKEVNAILMLSPGKGRSVDGALLDRLYRLNLSIYITPDLYGAMSMKPRLSSVKGEPLVDITNAQLSPMTQNLKRLGDIVLSSMALIVLSPVYLALAIAVKLSSPGPVFYRQERIGYRKEPFDIIKFRTMYVDAEKNGPALTSDDDPRTTPLGKWLRKYRLDEIPQFWNVLKGDMSLVGPRPERQYYIDKIVARHPAYALIHQVRPGLTSWGMVRFGYANNVDQMVERLRYDLFYLDNVSLGVDLKIMFHTVATVFSGKGK